MNEEKKPNWDIKLDKASILNYIGIVGMFCMGRLIERTPDIEMNFPRVFIYMLIIVFALYLAMVRENAK